MDFSSAINEIMPLVNDGDKDKPFIITCDSAYGDWQVFYPTPDKADSFTLSQREHDPYAAKYYGEDFGGGSMPNVYDKVLCDRLRLEYYEFSGGDRNTDADKKRLSALINFFEDNIGAFSQTVTDYLTQFDKPFRALSEMCPYNLATDNAEWTFNEDLAMDAVDNIEKTVAKRLSRPKDEPDKQRYDGYIDLNKIAVNDSEIILSENPNAEHRYMVVENRFTDYYNNLGDNNIYTGHTNDYLEAITVFTQKVQYNIDCVKSRQIDCAVLNSDDCLPGSNAADYRGKLIVVKANELKPEFRNSENQLVLCSHGNGARPGAIGTSVFGKELFSDESVCYGRHQIAGIADPDKLPDWAKLKLSQPEKQEIKPTQSTQAKQPSSLLSEIQEAAQLVEKRKTERGNAPAVKKRDGLEV